MRHSFLYFSNFVVPQLRSMATNIPIRKSLVQALELFPEWNVCLAYNSYCHLPLCIIRIAHIISYQKSITHRENALCCNFGFVYYRLKEGSNDMPHVKTSPHCGASRNIQLGRNALYGFRIVSLCIVWILWERPFILHLFFLFLTLLLG